MKKYTLSLILLFTFFVGCSSEIPEPVFVPDNGVKVSYVKDVKPILDSRCVVCHSCYNSPCQLKLSSFEGIDRGGSKEVVYLGERLRAQNPTRLFIDAINTKEWRDKNFFSVTQSDANESYNNSIMIHLLDLKRKYPQSKGEYRPDTEKLTCSKDLDELGEFMDDEEHKGMPYGFPGISNEEFTVLATWLKQGAQGPSALEEKKMKSPTEKVGIEIEKWDTFLNADDLKHQVTARYIYEHYFLAHLNFKDKNDEFYELVRSSTPYPQKIKLVQSLRPYDDPKVDRVYYRFVRIHSSIVHKTHMVVDFDDRRLAYFKKIFIETPWKQDAYKISYNAKTSANPFDSFRQIPPLARYQFLLDNAHYILMTFIRGPVCKGQIALNVLHDHTWLFFMEPEHDLGVQYPNLLLSNVDNLELPTQVGSNVVLWESFSDTYKKKAQDYYHSKQNFYSINYMHGLDIDAIWKGNIAKDSPALTIYRHYDSASVHHGLIGSLPDTAWVLDYSVMERIYYTLVAGFDVYGNVGHQLTTRRYADSLRIEMERNFIDFLPRDKRETLYNSWYKKMDADDFESYRETPFGTQIEYKTEHVKEEFIKKLVDTHFLNSTNIHFDEINYMSEDSALPTMPTHFENRADYIEGLKSLTLTNSAFIQAINGNNSNLAYIRIKMNGEKDKVLSLVINRYHENVAFLFGEEDRLDSGKDTADFVEGFVGSYPNFFFVVEEDDMGDFMKLLQSYEDDDESIARLLKYGVKRNDKDFWKHYDWFQKRFYEDEPKKAGLFDLNRYYYRAF